MPRGIPSLDLPAAIPAATPDAVHGGDLAEEKATRWRTSMSRLLPSGNGRWHGTRPAVVIERDRIHGREARRELGRRFL